MLAGGRASKALAELERASEAFADDHPRDALRILRPLRDRYPTAAAVRELIGLSHYALGNFRAARTELEEFARLSGSTEQHPVLMDCARAHGSHAVVERLWEELRAESIGAALVTEGRIVLAGSLADRGRLDEAVKLLERRAEVPGRVRAHHLRLWYALADLHERSGNLPRARALFTQVQRHDATFVDVAERLAALG